MIYLKDAGWRMFFSLELHYSGYTRNTQAPVQCKVENNAGLEEKQGRKVCFRKNKIKALR